MSNEAIPQRIERLLHDVEIDFGEFNLLEKEGEPAFDLVLARLEAPGLGAEHQARALNLLLMLTRQFCVRRLPDAVRVALRFTNSADPLIRASAVGVAMRGSRAIPAFRDLARDGVESPTREEVQASIRQAVVLGIDDALGVEVQEFLRPSKPGAGE